MTWPQPRPHSAAPTSPTLAAKTRRRRCSRRCASISDAASKTTPSPCSTSSRRTPLRAAPRRAARCSLAASDLVKGRADRAGRWLETARQADARPEEMAYWRGRWNEIGRKPEAAVRAYAEAVMAAPWSPWASSSRGRLVSEALAKVTADSGAAWAKGTTRAELQLAWIALGDVDPRGQRARETLRAAFLAEPRSAPFLRAQILPAAEWPLWRQPLARTDELLLSLGGWSEGGSALIRHFPLEILAGVDRRPPGGARRQPAASVGIAETLMQRVPPAVLALASTTAARGGLPTAVSRSAGRRGPQTGHRPVPAGGDRPRRKSLRPAGHLGRLGPRPGAVRPADRQGTRESLRTGGHSPRATSSALRSRSHSARST